MCLRNIFKRKANLEQKHTTPRFSKEILDKIKPLEISILIDDKNFIVSNFSCKTDIKKIAKIKIIFLNKDVKEITELFKCGDHTITYDNKNYTNSTIENIKGNMFIFEGYDLT